MTTLRAELLDELLAGYEKPEDLLGEEGLFKQLKKALLERALGAELSEHLGYEKGDPAGRGSGNSRNGYSEKTVLSEDGEIGLAVPRDRNGTFEPLIVPKGERRLEGFDERIVSHLCTDAVSIGPYVLSGGELPAMVLVDAIARRLPGALAEGSGELESFSRELDGGIEYPHYTRPAEYRGWEVPDVLLSGDHAGIDSWRREQSRVRSAR
jgi:hypothetical protein